MIGEASCPFFLFSFFFLYVAIGVENELKND